jgi:hypothetical protein
MTENNIEVWAPLASDLWGIEKSFGEYTPAEEQKVWREAVRVLDGFCQVADGLNHEPLILALVDAKVRAEEELRRAQDRAERSEADGADLHPRERERLEDMLMRSNALSNAIAVRVNHDNPERYGYAEEMAVLEEMRRETDQALERYKAEAGLQR